MAVPNVPVEERRKYIGAQPGGDNEALDAVWALAVVEVNRVAPDAPEATAKVAALAVMSYLWSSPAGESTRGKDGGGTGIRPGSALRKSGALALLRPYRVHRAGSI